MIDATWVVTHLFGGGEGGGGGGWEGTDAQRGGRCAIPGNIKGQVGLGSEQTDQVDVPAHLRGLE